MGLILLTDRGLERQPVHWVITREETEGSSGAVGPGRDARPHTPAGLGTKAATSRGRKSMRVYFVLSFSCQNTRDSFYKESHMLLSPCHNQEGPLSSMRPGRLPVPGLNSTLGFFPQACPLVQQVPSHVSHPMPRRPAR